jgi:apolipoprotein N-acyltransferase
MLIASAGGIWAVSYVVWLLNFMLAQGYVARSKKVMAACGAFLGLYFGLNAFTGFPRPGEMKVGMLQTDTQVLDVLAVYNAEAKEQGAEIVVWPELAGQASAPFGLTDQLLELASRPDQAAFVTSFEDGNEMLPYNAAAIFSSEGESERYRKRKLFGGESNFHQRGSAPASARVGGVTYGINICFDSCFPLIMRDTAMLEDVSMVLLPTLDPIGPYGTVQAFHAAYTPFRAAEMGVPIVRTDTTAYSMVVDARGVIVAQMRSGYEGVTLAEVTPERRDTLYRRLGDWFLVLCGFIVVAGLIKGRTAGPRQEKSSLRAKKR